MALTKITSRILDSSGVTILGTIATGVWQGTAINQTYLVGQSGTNTGDETLARINALDVTELGTISSGVWNGTVIASAYLDADTAHLSTTQTFTGAKTFSSGITQSSGTLQIKNDSGDSSGLKLYQAGSDVSTISNHYAGDIAFNTANTSQKMIIKNSGNVGIGTSSPSGKLHLTSSGGTDGLRINAGTSSSNFAIIANNQADNATLFYVKGNGDGLFGGNASAVRLFSASGGNATNPMIAVATDQDTGIFFPSANTMAFTTGNAERMRISSGSSPLVTTGDLKVAGSYMSNGNATLYINGAAAVDPSWIYWQQGSNLRWLSGLEGSSTDFWFLSYGSSGNGNPRLILKENGKVGIGTTSPIEKLQVAGQIISTGSNSTSATAGAERAIMDLSGFSSTDHSARFGHFRGTNSAGAGQLRLYTDSVERLRIDASGKVGIGTASPGSKLTVVGGTSTFVYDNSPQGTASSVYRDAVFGSTQTANTGITIFGTGQGGISFGDAGSNIRGQVRYQHSSDTLELGAAGNIDMFISSAKGIAAPSRSFHSGHDGSTGSSGAGTATVGCTLGSGGFLTAHRANATCLYIGTTTDREVMAIFKGTSQAGKIRITGASTVAFESGSDYRLKEDLKDFNGLDIISKLKVYNFNWIGEDRRDHGLIAHEVQEVLPDLVSGEKDGVLESGKIDKQTLDYGRFTPMLIKAMQEQQTIIEDLKSRIQTLEG